MRPDDKIIAVLENDLVWGSARDIRDVPAVLTERLQHYFLTYKLVPRQKPSAKIKMVYGRRHAHRGSASGNGGLRRTHAEPLRLTRRRGGAEDAEAGITP